MVQTQHHAVHLERELVRLHVATEMALGDRGDLTEQLVNMITAQRNFQANAQMISTADQVTQTIINIR